MRRIRGSHGSHAVLSGYHCKLLTWQELDSDGSRGDHFLHDLLSRDTQDNTHFAIYAYDLPVRATRPSGVPGSLELCVRRGSLNQNSPTSCPAYNSFRIRRKQGSPPAGPAERDHLRFGGQCVRLDSPDAEAFIETHRGRPRTLLTVRNKVEE